MIFLKKKALYKNIIVQIKKTFGRFLSIVAMIFLGVFVFIGLKITGPVMRMISRNYIEEYNLSDLNISSVFGLDEKDFEILKGISGISQTERGYSLDLIEKSSNKLIRLQSENKDISTYEMVSGRLPENNNEIALSNHMKDMGFKLNDELVFEKEENLFEDKEKLSNYSYKIVGFLNSPENVSNIVKEASTEGNGKIDGVGIISEENFKSEKFSVIRLRFSDLLSKTGVEYGTDEYRLIIQKHRRDIKEAFKNRPKEQYDKLHNKIKNKLAEGRQKINDGKAKIKDGEDKIREAEEKIKDGYIKYNNSLVEFNEKINSAENKIKKNQESISEADEKLKEGKKELFDNEVKLKAAVEKFNGNFEKFSVSKREWETKNEEYLINLKKYEQGLKDSENGKKLLQAELIKLKPLFKKFNISEEEPGVLAGKLENEIYKVNQGIINIENLLKKVSQMKSELAKIKNQIQALSHLEALLDSDPLKKPLLDLKAAKLKIDQAILKIETELSKLPNLDELYENRKTLIAMKDGVLNFLKEKINLDNSEKILKEVGKQLTEGKQSLDFGKSQILKAEAEIEKAKTELDEAKIEFERAKKLIDKNQGELDKGKNELLKAKNLLLKEKAKGERELQKALTKLKDGEIELNNNKLEFETKKKEALIEIEDGEKELDKGAKNLKKLKEPKYFYSVRDDQFRLFQYVDSSYRLDFLSNIFPIFFFLVAVLVSLTTMSRLVEEQRLEIGTMKALGYKVSDIRKKYTFYGSLSSCIGVVLGIFLGHLILSKIIFNAYSVEFVFKNRFYFIFFYKYALIAFIIGFLCTGFAAFISVKNSLKETPALLMRPKPPKKGSRILLERFKIIWNKLTFMQKVTMRNLFRYKKRMLMTTIGIAGCTGLLFFGFALRSSFKGLIKRQFEDMFNYDIISLYDRELEDKEFENYKQLIINSKDIKKFQNIKVKTLKAENTKGPDIQISLFVSENNENLNSLINIIEKKTGKVMQLKDGGAIITEKLAYLLNKKEGDFLEVEDDNGNAVNIKISGIAENYLGHFIYITSNYHKDLFGENSVTNATLMKLNNISEEVKSEFKRELMKNKIVYNVEDSNSSRKIMEETLKSLDIVVFMIIVCSSLLAFVVLYNLININISERKRELSTVKVLGFYPKELTEYVYRETLLLTLIGILFGFLLGIGMHRIIITKLAVDTMIFIKNISILTYVYSALITIGFSLIVMIAVHIKLKKIDMVEALKAVE